jgi:hypothetical protein
MCCSHDQHFSTDTCALGADKVEPRLGARDIGDTHHLAHVVFQQRAATLSECL